MPETFDGIPLHPLVVHAVVVLLPLAALLVFGAAVSARFRHWAALLPPALATLALIAVPLATSTGESLEESVRETTLVEEHAELGEQVLPWAIGLAVAAWVLWWLARRSQGRTRGGDATYPTAVTFVVAVLALVAVAGAGYSVYRAGHSGAAAVWSGTNSGGGESEDE